MAKYDAAIASGSADAAGYLTRAQNLEKVAARLAEEAAVAASGASAYLVFGLLFFAALRCFQGYYANMRYEEQYLTWRAVPQTR